MLAVIMTGDSITIIREEAMKSNNHTNYYSDLIAVVDIETVAREYLTITNEDSAVLYCDCPRHSSVSHRSLVVDKEKQLWFCFGCAEGGNVLQLIEFAKHGVVTKGITGRMPSSHREARDMLANIAKMPPLGKTLSDDRVAHLEDSWAKTERTFDCLTHAARHCHDSLMKEKEVLEWLVAKYGFKDATIKKYQIGYSLDDGSLHIDLMDKDFSEQEMLSTGLFRKGNEDELIPVFDGRITFPYWSKGFGVTYLIARKTPWTPENSYESGKYKKLPTHDPERRPYVNACIKNDRLFNEDCLRGKPSRVLIPEGMPDVLSVLETGEASVSPITVRFRKDDRERIAEKLCHLDVPIILIPDNEMSQVGLRAAKETARSLIEKKIDARIALLPLDAKQKDARRQLSERGIDETNLDAKLKTLTGDEKNHVDKLLEAGKIDANEFLKNHDQKDFAEVIDAALTPLQIDIEALSPGLKDATSEKVFRQILQDISDLDPVVQDRHVQELSKKIKTSVLAVRQSLKEVKKNRSKNKEDEETPFQALLRLFNKTEAEVFLDQHGSGWITTKFNDHWENVKIKSSAFQRNMQFLYVSGRGTGVSRETIGQFGDYLEEGAKSKERRYLYNRLAWIKDRLYVDMCTPTWECIEVTSEGWSIVTLERPPFKRFSHQQPLPVPKRDGDLKQIVNHVRFKNDKSYVLFCIWLVASLIEKSPRPGIVLYGIHGSGKSTVAKLVRLVIDPSSVLTLSLSKNEAEFVQLMEHHALINLDNLSWFPSWASDAVCRAVTGGGVQKRALYTDDDDVTYDYRRTFILNGISILSTAPDLLDRSIIIELDRISPKQMKTEQVVLEEFEEIRPSILGGILDTLVKAMKIRPTIQFDRLPRMSDWFLWGCAVAQAMGIPQEKFVRAYYENVKFQHEEAVEADPVANAVIEFMDKDQSPYWIGTPSSLYSELSELAKGMNFQNKHWPSSSSALSKRLKKLSYNLGEVGIVIEYPPRTTTSRMIKITRKKRREQIETRGVSLSVTNKVSESAVIPVMPSLPNRTAEVAMTGTITQGSKAGLADDGVMDSDHDLPENPDDWPDQWRVRFLTLSGVYMDEGFSVEESDRLAEKEIRRGLEAGTSPSAPASIEAEKPKGPPCLQISDGILTDRVFNIKKELPEEVRGWDQEQQKSLSISFRLNYGELRDEDQALKQSIEDVKTHSEASYKGGEALEHAEGTTLTEVPDVVDSDEHEDQEVFPAAKQTAVPVPPKAPKKKRSAIIETDEILTAALKSAGKKYKDWIKQSTGKAYRKYSEKDTTVYDVAEMIARDEAVGYYIYVGGLDKQTKSSTLIAKWRKAGWWPPRVSKEKHRVEFFTSLADRVDHDRPWDYEDLTGSSSRRPNAVTYTHEELIEKIREVFAETRDFDDTMRNLNKRNILSPRGRAWTPSSFMTFYLKWLND